MEPCEGVLFDRKADVLAKNFGVELGEVFRALPKINRFNGHTKWPYSVARHSIICADVALIEYNITDPDLLMAVLFHDGAEAYIGDLVRPIKQHFNGDLSKVEERLTKKIYKKLKLPRDKWTKPWFKAMLREIDTRVAVTEADFLTSCPTILPAIPRIHNVNVQHFEGLWLDDERLFFAAYSQLFDAKQRERDLYPVITKEAK